MNGSMPGMGWLPDVPSVSDYSEDHPAIAPLLGKTKLAAQGPRGSAGRAAGALDWWTVISEGWVDTGQF